jgi:hypothetical protein
MNPHTKDAILGCLFLLIVGGVPSFCFGMGALEVFKPTTKTRKVATFVGVLTVGYLVEAAIGVTLFFYILPPFERMRDTGDYRPLLPYAVIVAISAAIWAVVTLASAIKRGIVNIIAAAIRKSRDH